MCSRPLLVFLTLFAVVATLWLVSGGPIKGPIQHLDATVLEVGMTGNGHWQTAVLKLQLPSRETVYLKMRSFQPVYVGEILPVNIYLTDTDARRDIRLAFEDIDYAPIDLRKQPPRDK